MQDLIFGQATHTKWDDLYAIVWVAQTAPAVVCHV